MASSSLATKGRYDVFLSFRGEDTRDNFTSHLFAALRQKRIKIFIDEEANRGDEISLALLNAIEGSKISIVIFSKNYASSSGAWMNFFLSCSSSDVRNQTGSFGDAFVKLEKQFEELPEKVHKWSGALTEASNISGWDSTNM
ncbi:hypothetical protein CISIN_1g0469701mg, partial [Citrus sinensis]